MNADIFESLQHNRRYYDIIMVSPGASTTCGGGNTRAAFLLLMKSRSEEVNKGRFSNAPVQPAALA